MAIGPSQRRQQALQESVAAQGAATSEVMLWDRVASGKERELGEDGAAKGDHLRSTRLYRGYSTAKVHEPAETCGSDRWCP